jgi:Mrp family chromosome partitioning ATPase
VTRTPGLLDGLRTGAWLDAQTFPPLRYAVPGVVPEGLTLLVGPPKVGKSWLTANLCLAVAAGGVALSAVPTPAARPVLLLALEDGDRRLQSRARKLLRGDPIPDLFTYQTRIRDRRVVDTVHEWCDQYGDDALVVIDTLGKVLPPAAPGESAYARDYRVAGAIKRIADDRPGLSVVVVHHDRKAGSDDFVDSVSGTHGLAGAADTIIALGRPRTTGEGLLRVTGRDVPERDYAVRLVDGHDWQLVGGDLDAATQAAQSQRATAGLGDDMARVVAAVSAAGGDGVSAADVTQATGLHSDLVRQYLARAARDGRVDRITRGRYGPTSTPVTSDTSVTTWPDWSA